MARERIMTHTKTRDDLAEVARLINEHDPDAPEVQQFIDRHRDDAEFVELAELSRTLKRAFLEEVRDRDPDCATSGSR